MVSRTDNRPLLDLDDLGWRDRFVLAGETVTNAERRELARRAAEHRLVRVRRGIYLCPPRGERPEDRHRDLVRAASLEDPARLFGHRSAAAIWRLPRLDSWPDAVDVVEQTHHQRRSTDGLRRHRTSVPADSDIVEGVRVTSLVRTAVDLARADSIASGLVAVDAALAGVRHPDGSDSRASRTELLRELDLLDGQRGIAGARWVVDFADGRAELPGESLSRLQIHRAGLPAPVLQHEFRDDEGSMFADFAWPDLHLVGEFDGAGKYLPAASAQLTRDVVLREKRREDRLRRMGERVVRWDWAIALDRNRLRSRLLAAGLR